MSDPQHMQASSHISFEYVLRDASQNDFSVSGKCHVYLTIMNGLIIELVLADELSQRIN